MRKDKADKEGQKKSSEVSRRIDYLLFS